MFYNTVAPKAAYFTDRPLQNEQCVGSRDFSVKINVRKGHKIAFKLIFTDGILQHYKRVRRRDSLAVYVAVDYFFVIYYKACSGGITGLRTNPGIASAVCKAYIVYTYAGDSAHSGKIKRKEIDGRSVEPSGCT